MRRLREAMQKNTRNCGTIRILHYEYALVRHFLAKNTVVIISSTTVFIALGPCDFEYIDIILDIQYAISNSIPNKEEIIIDLLLS